jgi:hypothetical protein
MLDEDEDEEHLLNEKLYMEEKIHFFFLYFVCAKGELCLDHTSYLQLPTTTTAIRQLQLQLHSCF